MVDSSFRLQEELEVKTTPRASKRDLEKIESNPRKGRKKGRVGGGPSFGEETLPSLVLTGPP